MKKTSDFEKFYLLKDDPFPLIPDLGIEPQAPIIWAGRKELKRKIENTLCFSVQTAASRIILLYGEWGSGKTHALRYFSIKENQERFSGDGNVLFCCFPLPQPMKAGTIQESIYSETMGVVEDTFKKEISAVINSLTEDMEKRTDNFWEIREKCLDEIKKITTKRDLAKVFYELARGSMSNKRTAWRYLRMDTAKTEHKNLGVSRGLESLEDILDVISSIFNMLTRPTDWNPEPKYREVFLWIDELEDVLAVSPRDRDLFNKFIRDLLGRVPSNLTILMNCSYGTEKEFRDIWDILSNAVKRRVAKRLEIGALEFDEAIEYVSECLNNPIYRPEELRKILESKDLDKLYPFEEEGIRFLLKNLESLAPGCVNLACSGVLELGLLGGAVSKPGDMLTKGFIESNLVDITGERPEE